MFLRFSVKRAHPTKIIAIDNGDAHWRATMDDRIEGDTGRSDLALMVLRCAVAAALFTTAAWLLTTYVLDSVFR